VTIEPREMKARQPWRGGSVGCLGGGFAGVVAVLLWLVLVQAMNFGSIPAAVVVILSVIVAAAFAFRRLHRTDPPVAVGMLIGLAIIGLLAGMCASY
jgi:uncharacterized membrane protein YhaH (DUF805 family)